MFLLHRGTQICAECRPSTPVCGAIKMLRRDMEKVLIPSSLPPNRILLLSSPDPLPEEGYLLEIASEQISLFSRDDLGFIYGLLYLSEQYLGVKPFWFWMDQIFVPCQSISVPEGSLRSSKPPVRFRGWFFNDEVLMLKWKHNQNSPEGWRMAFEALLRCGGNIAIPASDKLSRQNRSLAASMGLWITHHHAQPLGAEMFARAYPALSPNYQEHPQLFEQLWEQAVLEQKDYKVIWNLSFRGQGDAPFWNHDTTGAFDTPQKRGALISRVIRRQCEIVRRHVKHPVFSTNLYGEIMELYEQGYIELDPDIIKIRADNGYGKMVTRRRDGHPGRVSSMPDPCDNGPQGVYYHVSFYDLQAANHITMLPNSVSFVNRELSQALAKGAKALWMINCSNIRPHVYYLDAVRKMWRGHPVSDEDHSLDFAVNYFGGSKRIARCYQEYPAAMLSYGPNEDDHAGEQFYTENLRILAHHLLIGSGHAPQLCWLTGPRPLREQIQTFCGICRDGLAKLKVYLAQCEAAGSSLNTRRVLFNATILLHARIHALCAEGVSLFGEACEAWENRDYLRAFLGFGRSAELFSQANNHLRQAEYGVWKDFYENDCFADIKHTAYMLRKLMSLMREFGDNVRHDQWYHKYCCSQEDQKVLTLLVTDNHMTDEELYQAMINSPIL